MELRFLCIMSIPDGLCRHAERKLLLRQHMLEKMNAKGYLEPDVVKAQTMEITARLNELMCRIYLVESNARIWVRSSGICTSTLIPQLSARNCSKS